MDTVHTLTRRHAVQLAHSYRNLVLSFGAQLLLTMVSFASARTANSPVREAIDLFVSVSGLLTFAALVYFGFRTAQALGSSVAWLWAVGMFLPCLNVITLLLLSSRATHACRAAGIPVGFLGPAADAIPGSEMDETAQQGHEAVEPR